VHWLFVTTNLTCVAYLAAHKQLFRLASVAHLRVMTAEALRGTHHRDYAVVFRQMFAGVPSADGVATVSVVRIKHHLNVVYVSSSLTPDAGRLTGKRALTPLAAWRRAAQAAGYGVSAGNAGPLGRSPDGSLAISAVGFSGTETVKPIAFAARPATARCAPTRRPLRRPPTVRRASTR